MIVGIGRMPVLAMAGELGPGEGVVAVEEVVAGVVEVEVAVVGRVAVMVKVSSALMVLTVECYKCGQIGHWANACHE